MSTEGTEGGGGGSGRTVGGLQVRRKVGRKPSRQAKARRQKAIARGLAVAQKGGLKGKKSRDRSEKLKALKDLW